MVGEPSDDTPIAGIRGDITLSPDEIRTYNLSIKFLRAAQEVSGGLAPAEPLPEELPEGEGFSFQLQIPAEVFLQWSRQKPDDGGKSKPEERTLEELGKAQLFQDMDQLVLRAYQRHGRAQSAAIMQKIDGYEAAKPNARAMGMLVLAQIIKEAAKPAP